MKNDSRQDPRIQLYDLAQGRLIEEVVFKGSFLNYHYGTRLGRLITHLYYKRIFYSKIYGYLQKRPATRKDIPAFIERYGINADEAEKPAAEYPSFNEFFIRKLKPDARPIHSDPSAFIAPADSRLLAFHIQDDVVVPVKGRKFTLDHLLGGKLDHSPYRGGWCLVFRLAPADYHRYCYIDEGTHGPIEELGTVLHSVHPLCLKHDVPVFRVNYRQLCVLQTKNFGPVAHIDVGAMRVGLIRQVKPQGGTFVRGEEKGLFEFGASTVILLVPPGKVELDPVILEHSRKGIETLVRIGAKIGAKASETQALPRA
jgi:phosphatidylserine decarboxylase